MLADGVPIKEILRCEGLINHCDGRSAFLIVKIERPTKNQRDLHRFEKRGAHGIPASEAPLIAGEYNWSAIKTLPQRRGGSGYGNDPGYNLDLMLYAIVEGIQF